MKEERMLILTMLNEGKITADEAVNLLNALTKSSEDKKSDFDNFARGVKFRATSFAERAEPKVKKAAKGIKQKSVEVFSNLKERIMDKTAQAEVTAGASEEFDYVDLNKEADDLSEKTDRDPEMARNEDTLPIE
ncbi:MAG: hypothetical protein J6A07_09230 [Firmicutes bacterium]|jgi:hypothetical protein|nr:hypothetical protein [Bacillota bacterium]